MSDDPKRSAEDMYTLLAVGYEYERMTPEEKAFIDGLIASEPLPLTDEQRDTLHKLEEKYV